MRVAITGATGFLGSNLTPQLLTSGFDVVALGRSPMVLAELGNLGVRTARVDLRNLEQLKTALKSVEVVCHLAALAEPWGRWQDFYSTNVQGTWNVLDACKSNGVRRLVFVSSPSVLFDGSDLINVTEDLPYPSRFISNYCTSKRLAEEAVRSAAGELEITIIRPKAIFGPGDKSLLPRILSAAVRKRLWRIGDGTNQVDLTYVDNVSQAIILAACNAAAANKLFHITNDEHVKLWPLIESILARFHLSLRGTITFAMAFQAARLIELAHRPFPRSEPPLTRLTVALLGRTQTFNIALAKNVLGYRPTISVTEGIARTLDSFAESSLV
jgi:nucleoside-diphosphate-sugar epimerase